MRPIVPFLFLLATAIPTQATEIRWATMGSGAADIADALGEPGTDQTTAADGSPLTFSGFSAAIDYDELESTLESFGASEVDVAEMDFIAFDMNGAAGGFEAASWTFDDGEGGILSVTHDFGSAAGPGMLFNDDITDPAYGQLFGEDTLQGFAGFVLFDLGSQGVNVAAPGFTVTVEGNGSNPAFNWPEISGVGILVPEPGAVALLAAGLARVACSRHRRRARSASRR